MYDDVMDYDIMQDNESVVWLPHNTFGSLAMIAQGMSQKVELVEVT